MMIPGKMISFYFDREVFELIATHGRKEAD